MLLTKVFSPALIITQNTWVSLAGFPYEKVHKGSTFFSPKIQS